MPTNIALGVKGGGGNTKMRRTEIVSDDSTLFQIFCPRLRPKKLSMLGEYLQLLAVTDIVPRYCKSSYVIDRLISSRGSHDLKTLNFFRSV